MVPRRGVAPARRINSLACPTHSKRPIEFQCLFLRLSHRPTRAAVSKISNRCDEEGIC
jgi:hypothetical protein